MTFTYNAQGQRVGKTTAAANTRYLYDFTNLLREIDADTDEVQRTYAFISESYGDLVSEYDELNDQDQAPLFDGQWSTSAVLNPAQDVEADYQYRAFGVATDTPGSGDSKLTFGGQKAYYNDPETELYFLGMGGNQAGAGRSYDPETGRFTSQDPIGFAAGDANLYRYTGNNPVNSVDPSGLIDLTPAWVDRGLNVVGNGVG